MKISSPRARAHTDEASAERRKEISIPDNHYCLTYTHELTIEIRSLNEEQVIKERKRTRGISLFFFLLVLDNQCSHANNLANRFVRAPSPAKPFLVPRRNVFLRHLIDELPANVPPSCCRRREKLHEDLDV